MRLLIVFLVLLSTLYSSSKAQELIPVRISELAKMTLEENPTIQRGELAVGYAKGGLKVQKSAFDYHLTSYAGINRSSTSLFDEDSRNSSLDGNLNANGVTSSLGIYKGLRTGQTVALNVNYFSLSDNYSLNRFSTSVDPNIADHYTTTSLSIVQPLLQGRGASIATALEKSATLDLMSAQSNLSYTNSIQILAVVTAYWQYVLAYNSAQAYEQNEARVRSVLVMTQELVKGDKRPRGDLAQAKADLANQERLSYAAKQNLIITRLNLGRAVGISDQESQKIGHPLDDFPSVEEAGFHNNLSLDLLQQMARNNRKDIEANQLSNESLALQVRLANNRRKAQLDLQGTLNYGATSMGNDWSDVGNSFTNAQGRDVGFEIGVSLDFPINNNRAKGSLIQSKALFEDQQVYSDDLIRNIDLNVTTAMYNIENSAAILSNAKMSLYYYRQVYENEQTKFKNGLTTLLNLILFQERLTFAELEYLQARQQFAIAIINLRFETGTLYAQSNSATEDITFTQDTFYTIPSTH